MATTERLLRTYVEEPSPLARPWRSIPLSRKHTWALSEPVSSEPEVGEAYVTVHAYKRGRPWLSALAQLYHLVVLETIIFTAGALMRVNVPSAGIVTVASAALVWTALRVVDVFLSRSTLKLSAAGWSLSDVDRFLGVAYRSLHSDGPLKDLCGCRVVADGISGEYLQTALQLVRRGAGSTSSVRFCRSRHCPSPLALGALEYIAARFNSALEANGYAAEVENDVAVDSGSGEPVAPSAELLAAAERSAASPEELGTLEPVARPWRTVPTVAVAGSGAVHVSASTQALEVAFPAFEGGHATRMGLVSYAYYTVILLMLISCVPTSSEVDRACASGVTARGDGHLACFLHAAWGRATGALPWPSYIFYAVALLIWLQDRSSTVRISLGEGRWHAARVGWGIASVKADGDLSDIMGAKVSVYDMWAISGASTIQLRPKQLGSSEAGTMYKKFWRLSVTCGCETQERAAAAISGWLAATNAVPTAALPENDVFPPFSTDLRLARKPLATKVQAAAIAQRIAYANGRWHSLTMHPTRPVASRVFINPQKPDGSMVVNMQGRPLSSLSLFAIAARYAVLVVGGTLIQVACFAVLGPRVNATITVLIAYVTMFGMIAAIFSGTAGRQRLVLGAESWKLTTGYIGVLSGCGCTGNIASLLGCEVMQSVLWTGEVWTEVALHDGNRKALSLGRGLPLGDQLYLASMVNKQLAGAEDAQAC